MATDSRQQSALAQLVVDLPGGRTQSHALGSSPVVLGRDPGCDIPLFDLSASRRHVRIVFEDGSYVLEDLAAKNGTLVNNRQVSRTALADGDEIMIGAVRVVFRDASTTTASMSVVVSDADELRNSTRYRHAQDELTLSHRRLQILYQLNDRLTRLRQRDELLEDAMDVCFEMLRFERGAIGIKQPTGQLVDWPVVRNLRGAEGELKVSRTILRSSLVDGERVIVNDTRDGPIDPTVSMVQHNIRSAMCVPLLSEDRNLGVIYGDQVSKGTTYTKEEIDFLAAIARLVTIGLINSQLLEEQKRKVQLEGEMQMARNIQTNLFPRNLPKRDDVSIAAINEPGFLVSGDYYDAVERRDGRIFFLIADVTGEGVAASLLMANLQAAVRVTVQRDDSPAALMNRWNQLISDNTEASRFITVLAGVLDPKKRTASMVSAGHHLPILLRGGDQIESVEFEPGFPLGVVENTTYQEHTVELGDKPVTILTYTDGVIEAMNEKMEQFGSQRLDDVLRSVDVIAPAPLIKRVRQAVQQHAGNHPQSDDITLLAVHLS